MRDGNEAPGFVGLAEVIRQVRDELELARQDGEGARIGFGVKRVNLEFTVQVHQSGSARGGLRIGVVTAELGGAVDRGTTHRVQVELEPESEGARLLIRRED